MRYVPFCVIVKKFFRVGLTPTGHEPIASQHQASRKQDGLDQIIRRAAAQYRPSPLAGNKLLPCRAVNPWCWNAMGVRSASR